MRSDSFNAATAPMQPWCAQGTWDRCGVWEGAVLHIFSIKVSDHRLLIQLNISTAGLAFLLFLPLFFVVVAARCGFTVICSAHSSLQDADVGRDA